MAESVVCPPLSGRAKETVDRCISEKRIPNGLILAGRDPDALEKTARYLCAGAACEKTAGPCGRCEPCRKIFAGISQDIIDVRPEDGRQGINVEGIRSVRSDAYITPGELDIKVYILHDADKMNAQAQNALLKVLEEPPSSVRFMLLCSNTAALLPTVRSRCWTVNVDGDPVKSGKPSKASGLVMKLLEALCGAKRSEVEGMISELPDDRAEYKAIIIELMRALRNVSAAKAGSTGALDDRYLEFAPLLSRSLSDAGVLRAYDCVRSALIENDANVHIATSQTALLSELWTAIHN